MKKLICKISIFIFAFLSFQGAGAQTLEDIRSQMVKDWQRAKEYTMEYLNTMPADKYSFKANDSIRTFAQQMLHLASGNIFFTSQATGEKMPGWLSFTLEQRASAQVKDSVVKYVMESYDYAVNSLKNTDISKWNDVVKMFNQFEVTKFALFNKAFEHQTHHRGQTTIYIRVLNIRPPQEKLF
jgi:uncharacterized damage-inducible protein DinB